MSATPRPQFQNHILASLPAEEYERLAPHLEQVELPHSKVIQESGGRIPHVYFPERSMVSLVSHTPEAQSVEAGRTEEVSPRVRFNCEEPSVMLRLQERTQALVIEALTAFGQGV